MDNGQTQIGTEKDWAAMLYVVGINKSLPNSNVDPFSLLIFFK